MPERYVQTWKGTLMKSEVLPTRPARVRNLDLTLPGDSHEVHRQPGLSGQRGLPARAFSGGAFQGLVGGVPGGLLRARPRGPHAWERKREQVLST